MRSRASVAERNPLAERLVAGVATVREQRETGGPAGWLAYVLRGPCPLVEQVIAAPMSILTDPRVTDACALGVCCHGPVKQSGVSENLITDAGDLYIAQMVIAGVQPANASAPTKAIGMKLGTGTTSPAKNGAGAALVTYQSGSHRAFDSANPITNNLGAGLGVQSRYVTTYPAGVVTVNGLAEAIICCEATLTDATNTAGTTACRALLSPVVNKGAADTLTITWNWKFLGA